MNRSFAIVRFSRRLASSAIAVAVLTAGCAPKEGPADSAGSSATAATDAVSIAKNRSEDLTGDSVPEKITLTARGPKVDSLQVRLEIRSADDSVLYASSWSSRYYFQYTDRASMSDAAADSAVRRHLDAVLVDTAFRTGATAPGDTIQASMMRDAIRYDIAANQWRVQHGLPLGAEIPPTAHDSINTIAAAVPKSQIDALYQELRGKKTFTFFAGGEVTYSIAWSAREQRFVTVFSCC